MKTDLNRFRHRVAVLLVVMLLGFVSLSMADGADDPDDPDNDISTQLLVELTPGATIDTLAARYDLTVIDYFVELSTWLVEVAPGMDAEAVEEQLENDPLVEDAESQELVEAPDGDQRSIPDLGLVIDQIDFLDQWGARTIKTLDAHQFQTGVGVIVAVLDSGVSSSSPELVGRMAGPGADFAGGNGTSQPQPDGIDNDGNGIVDEGVHHGTFVAGLVRLAAPDAFILPVRVLNSEGRGTISGLTRGIFFAVAQHADVINLSMSAAQSSSLVEEAIEFAVSRGIIVVASAGNEGLPEVRFPANTEDVIAVASVNEALEPSPFTNSGGEVLVGAPGQGILSSVATVNGYGGWDGTSFAAPLVSGAVALLLERYPGVSTTDVREAIGATAIPYPTAPLSDMGSGVLDLEALASIERLDRNTVWLDDSAEGTVVRWSPVLGAQHYDIVRGNLDELSRSPDEPRGTDLGTLTCLDNDRDATAALTITDGTSPLPGRGFFYLWRDDAPEPVGYGEGSRGDRIPGAGDCPAI